METIQFKLDIVMILRFLYAFEHFDVIGEHDDVIIIENRVCIVDEK